MPGRSAAQSASQINWNPSGTRLLGQRFAKSPYGPGQCAKRCISPHWPGPRVAMFPAERDSGDALGS